MNILSQMQSFFIGKLDLLIYEKYGMLLTVANIQYILDLGECYSVQILVNRN